RTGVNQAPRHLPPRPDTARRPTAGPAYAPDSPPAPPCRLVALPLALAPCEITASAVIAPHSTVSDPAVTADRSAQWGQWVVGDSAGRLGSSSVASGSPALGEPPARSLAPRWRASRRGGELTARAATPAAASKSWTTAPPGKRNTPARSLAATASLPTPAGSRGLPGRRPPRHRRPRPPTDSEPPLSPGARGAPRTLRPPTSAPSLPKAVCIHESSASQNRGRGRRSRPDATQCEAALCGSSISPSGSRPVVGRQPAIRCGRYWILVRPIAASARHLHQRPGP